LKRFNDGVARGEAALAMAMLLLMIFVAFAQAFLRNMTNAGFGWANVALGWIDWADFVLAKGTLWLAFLGASLAVHSDKHVAIDAIPRLVSPRARLIMRGTVGIVGAIACFYLARAFWAAILINAEERSNNAELLTDRGSIHVCDATSAELAAFPEMSQGIFCVLRSFLGALGVRFESPGAAFQLIVPVMFIFMCVRMAGNGIYDFMKLARGQLDDDPTTHGLAGAATDVAHDIEDGKKDR
jgi:TRAP-type C4-dicarboxylate transport system permease small subunit